MSDGQTNKWMNIIFVLTGDWQIDYLTGGPIDMYIGDTADVRVYSMQDGTICNIPHLIGKSSCSQNRTQHSLRNIFRILCTKTCTNYKNIVIKVCHVEN